MIKRHCVNIQLSAVCIKVLINCVFCLKQIYFSEIKVRVVLNKAIVLRLSLIRRMQITSVEDIGNGIPYWKNELDFDSFIN